MPLPCKYGSAAASLELLLCLWASDLQHGQLCPALLVALKQGLICPPLKYIAPRCNKTSTIHAAGLCPAAQQTESASSCAQCSLMLP